MIIKLQTETYPIADKWSAWVFVKAAELKAQHVGYYSTNTEALYKATQHARRLSDAYAMVDIETTCEELNNA